MDIKIEPEDVVDSDAQYENEWRNYTKEFEESGFTVKTEKFHDDGNIYLSNNKPPQVTTVCSESVKSNTAPVCDGKNVQHLLKIKIEKPDDEQLTIQNPSIDSGNTNNETNSISVEGIPNNIFRIKVEKPDDRGFSPDGNQFVFQGNTKSPLACSSQVSPNVEHYSEIGIDEIDIKKESSFSVIDNNSISLDCQDDRSFWLGNPFPAPVPKIILERVPWYRNYFVCNVCFSVFPTVAKQELHKIIHKPFSSILYKNFSDSDKLKHDNLLMKMSSEKQQSYSTENLFTCGECGYTCRHLSKFKSHKMTHSGEKPIKCDECDYTCILTGDLKRHKLIHSGEKPFKCEHCDFSCRQFSYIKTHQRIHSGEKPFKCEHCEFTSSYSSAMRKHKMIHSGEKPFKCEECDYSSKQSYDMKTHKIIHSGKNPLKCDKCEYSSFFANRIKKHQAIHCVEKPYKCDDCDYSCTVPSRLKEHKLIHTGQKPFTCHTCSFACRRLPDLKRHQKIHLTQKPLQV